jgi:hypothetical protein
MPGSPIMTKRKRAIELQRFQALSGPLKDLNEELKIIFADLLLQRPPDPFVFVAERLRKGIINHDRAANTEPELLCDPEKNGHSPTRLPMLTDGEKRKRRGMQPPEDLLKFYLNSYRFTTKESVKIFRGLADDEWTRKNGRLITTMPIFARVVAQNASYADDRMERRMADRLFDALIHYEKVSMSYLRIIPAASALSALSVGSAEERIRATFYYHGYKFSSPNSTKPLPKAAQTAQVLINFFNEGLRCTQSLELAGLGAHVRSRLSDQYTKDREALERAILIFVKKLYPREVPSDCSSKYQHNVSFNELCRRVFVPSCWLDSWVQIWARDKHPDIWREHSDIAAARWVKAALYQADTAIEVYESPDDPDVNEKTLFELSPRLDISEEAEQKEMAMKIQARYRGHAARKGMKEKTQKDEMNAAVKMQSQFRGHRVRLAKAKEFAEEQDAATKLQSRYRGYQTRQQLKQGVPPMGIESTEEEGILQGNEEEQAKAETDEEGKVEFDFMRSRSQEKVENIDQTQTSEHAPPSQDTDEIPDDALSVISDDAAALNQYCKQEVDMKAVDSLISEHDSAEMPSMA